MSLCNPVITVLMSVYNAEPYLEQAVLSIRNQSYRDFEFLIINDGSLDGSATILEKHARADKRIRLIHQENRGLIAALNRGVREAKGQLIARMDSDDIALRERLKVQLERMQADSSLALIGGHVQLINELGQVGEIIRFPVGDEAVRKSLYYGSPVAHPSVMMRRNLVLEVGGYREFYRHCEDYDLWLRLSEKANIDNVEEVVLQYRRHGDSVSVGNRETQTVGTFLSQAAWLIRQAGAEDPTPNWTCIDRELLKAVPLSSRDRWSLLARWTLSTIDGLPIEEIDEGIALLKDLHETPGKREADGSIELYRMNGKLARNALMAGKKRRALMFVINCFRYQPTLAMKDAFSIGTSRMTRAMRSGALILKGCFQNTAR